MLIIVGCGRSGTTYTSKAFSELGLDIGHEKIGKDGVISWSIIGDKSLRPPWGPTMDEINAANPTSNIDVVHQVRNPLKAIPSICGFTKESWDFISSSLGWANRDSLLKSAMNYWYEWNLRACRVSSYTYQVEMLPEVMGNLLHLGGLKSSICACAVRKIPTDINTRTNSMDASILAMKKEDKSLFKDILGLGRVFGYSI